VSDTFLVNKENQYKIKSLHIIPFSEKIFVSKMLINKNQYKIFYETGTFSFNENDKLKINDTIIIVYQSLKINLRNEYKRRNIITVYDTLSKDSIKISRPLRNILSGESIFGKNMQKSGAIIRGFTIGTNRDFTLNSGLRLQLNGKISDDIELIAALTDENTPIQPEGNTETLQELDKVFIELRHKYAAGTFGDFDFIDNQSEFSRLTKKLQGLKGEFDLQKTEGNIVIASSRGKFNSIQFFGKDGNQGPYRLYGVNNERAIIIIAGSERVYLDGQLMKRGENNDYTIDYSNAEITFTPKRLITSFSRISVDFEYTDQNYTRNFFGANFSTQLYDDKIKFGINYYREGDDENNPISLTLSDNDLKILREAGDNRNAAAKSGVSLAQLDSSNNVRGFYTKIDTVINSRLFSYYLYSPGSVNSIYNVSFSYAGEGKGDYVKESLGNYKFVGIGKGNYLPVIFLPLPELKQTTNIYINADISKGIKLSGEFSGSIWDKNRFSTIDDNDNFGYARKLLFEIEPRKIEIGSINFGKAGISYKDRFIQSRYTSLDRINIVEFNRYYNISDLQNDNQTLREIGLTYFPFETLSIFSQYGYLKNGNSFSSDRYFNEIKFSDNKNYNFYYKLDYVKSNNENVTTKWNRQNSSNFYSFGIIKPGFEFLFENKEEKKYDSLLSSSYKFSELIPSLELNSSYLNFRFSYSFREEYFPINNFLEKQSDANITQIQIGFNRFKEFSSSLSFTFRKKYYKDKFLKMGFTNNETILLLSQSRFNLFQNFIYGDLYYQAATEQTSKLEKVFMKVPKGSGNYFYIGDNNNNGIADENEFQLTSYDGEYILITVPTEQLFPVIDLKSYIRWTTDFDKIISGKNLFASLLKNLSSETFLRIEENSKDKVTKEIYLMKLSKFLNDSTTLRGSQLFQQDFFLFKNNSKFSVRMRYFQRKSLNQFSGGVERGFFKERSIRLRFSLVKEINNQTDFVNQVDNLLPTTISNRARKIDRNDLSTDFSYRPMSNLEVGFKIQTGRSKDSYPQIPTTVDMNSLLLRVNYSITNSGRIRIETERLELTANTSISNIPFEITRGNVIGKNYFWRAFFDYRIGSNVQTSLSYDARLLGRNKVIHTMHAEARAFF